MKIFKIVMLLLVLIFAGFHVLFFYYGHQSQSQMAQSSLVGSHLDKCGMKPNCVSTQDGRPEFKIDLEQLGFRDWEILQAQIAKNTRFKLVKKDPSYLHYEYKSKTFGFVDDVEFLKTPEGKIEGRSSSRVGHSDLGANRTRMESLVRQVIFNRPE